MKKLIVFDLDGTLAESKASLDAEMAKLLTALLGIVKVAVISGGDWPQSEPGNPNEIEGVLNPVATRGTDGKNVKRTML